MMGIRGYHFSQIGNINLPEKNENTIQKCMDKVLEVIIRQIFYQKLVQLQFLLKHYDLSSVPGHLNKRFWLDFDSKFGVLGMFQGFRGPKMQKSYFCSS